MKAVGFGLVALGALVISSCATKPPSTPRSSSEKVYIAIPEFALRTSGPDEGHFARLLPEIIGQDLRFSSLFTVVVNEPLLPPDPAAALRKRLADLAAAGTHVAMQGGVTVSGQRVTVEFRLLDLTGPGVRPIAAKTFWAEPLRIHRGLAHRIADEIVYQLTGERGIAETKIAYVTRAGANKELAWMDYDGFNQAPLTSLQSISLWPVWSPRAPILAFTSFFRGYPHLWWLDPFNARQRQPELISAWPGQSSVAAWSPDGQTLALTLSYQGNSEIYKVRVGSSIFERLTHQDGIDTDATWAPSGRHLVYSSTRTGRPQLLTMLVDGSEPHGPLPTREDATSPTWSPRLS